MPFEIKPGIVSIFGTEIVAQRWGGSIYLGTRPFDGNRDRTDHPQRSLFGGPHDDVVAVTDEEARDFAHRILRLLENAEDGDAL